MDILNQENAIGSTLCKKGKKQEGIRRFRLDPHNSRFSDLGIDTYRACFGNFLSLLRSLVGRRIGLGSICINYRQRSIFLAVFDDRICNRRSGRRLDLSRRRINSYRTRSFHIEGLHIRHKRRSVLSKLIPCSIIKLFERRRKNDEQ